MRIVMNNARSRRATRDSAAAASDIGASGSDAPESEAAAPIAAASADPAAAAPDDTESVAAPVAGGAAVSEPLPLIEPPPIAAAPVTPRPAADGWSALTEVQAVFGRACEEVAVEVTDVARSGVAAGADAALALLDARTYAEAIEINAGLARRGAAMILVGSARLSEIGVKAMAEVARPLFAGLSGPWGSIGAG
jgi:hypothetical protein